LTERQKSTSTYLMFLSTKQSRAAVITFASTFFCFFFIVKLFGNLIRLCSTQIQIQKSHFLCKLLFLLPNVESTAITNDKMSR